MVEDGCLLKFQDRFTVVFPWAHVSSHRTNQWASPLRLWFAFPFVCGQLKSSLGVEKLEDMTVNESNPGGVVS